MARPLFSDGLNSFFHVAFGVLGASQFIVVPLFVLYQFQKPSDPNLAVDIAEFFLGWCVAVLL